MITILQINLNNCKTAQDLMIYTEKKYHIDLTLITEPYKAPEEDMFWISSKNNTACIHWNPDGRANTCIKRRSGRYSTSIQWNDYVFVSCYISPNVDINEFEEFLDELDNIVTDAQEYKIIIGGDFNSKSTMWGASQTNTRGDRLERWSSSRDMILVNYGNKPTCIRSLGSSIIDLTWCNYSAKSQIISWEVMDLETLSDHAYIIFTIGTNKVYSVLRHKRRYVRWSHKKMDIDRYRGFDLEMHKSYT